MGQNCPGFGRSLNGLFKQAITAGKRVRAETSISTGSVSVSSAAVELAQLKLPTHNWEDARACIIGAGKMSTLLVKHLFSKGCRKVTLLNRSLPRAEVRGARARAQQTGRQAGSARCKSQCCHGARALGQRRRPNAHPAAAPTHAALPPLRPRAQALAAEYPEMQFDIRLMPDLMACVEASDVIFAASGSEELLITKQDVEGEGLRGSCAWQARSPAPHESSARGQAAHAPVHACTLPAPHRHPRAALLMHPPSLPRARHEQAAGHCGRRAPVRGHQRAAQHCRRRERAGGRCHCVQRGRPEGGGGGQQGGARAGGAGRGGACKQQAWENSTPGADSEAGVGGVGVVGGGSEARALAFTAHAGAGHCTPPRARPDTRHAPACTRARRRRPRRRC